MKEIFEFIKVFSLLGLQMFGNIVTMYPLLEEELVTKRNWVTKDDILDSIAFGRCGPGAAVINTIVLLGNKIKGFWGGALAAISFIFFPLVLIVTISFCLEPFMKNEIIKSAFNGILVALSVMIINTIFDLGRKTIKGRMTGALCIVTLFLCIFTEIPLIFYIITSILVGIAICTLCKSMV